MLVTNVHKFMCDLKKNDVKMLNICLIKLLSLIQKSVFKRKGLNDNVTLNPCNKKEIKGTVNVVDFIA